jgi:hypothetical protein
MLHTSHLFKVELTMDYMYNNFSYNSAPPIADPIQQAPVDATILQQGALYNTANGVVMDQQWNLQQQNQWQQPQQDMMYQQNMMSQGYDPNVIQEYSQVSSSLI